MHFVGDGAETTVGVKEIEPLEGLMEPVFHGIPDPDRTIGDHHRLSTRQSEIPKSLQNSTCITMAHSVACQSPSRVRASRRFQAARSGCSFTQNAETRISL